MTPQEFIIALLPSLTVAIIMAHYTKKQARKDEEEKERVEIREKSEKLKLDLIMADGMLTYAVAMAIKRGAPNGEIEEGIDAYTNAMEAFHTFERSLVAKSSK